MQTAAQRLGCENRESQRGKGGRANPKISAREAEAGHGGTEMASSAAAAALELAGGGGGGGGVAFPGAGPLCAFHCHSDREQERRSRKGSFR